ncbi:MAG TPA: biotin transporter BioY [Candidatus Limnocylindrales bacterium]
MLATPRLNRLPAMERGITIGDFLVPIRVGERLSSRMRHLALILVGALFIALTANFSLRVPGSPVPVTGQTLSVLVVGGALGFRRGLLATAMYLVLGFGLPVYAEHHQGIATIASIGGGRLVLGATGGYLVGFVVAAGLVGRLAELGWDRSPGGAVAAMVLGNLVIYAVGLPWLAAATGASGEWTVRNGFLPFVAGDALKLVLAAGLFPVAWWLVGRRVGER